MWTEVKEAFRNDLLTNLYKLNTIGAVLTFENYFHWQMILPIWHYLICTCLQFQRQLLRVKRQDACDGCIAIYRRDHDLLGNVSGKKFVWRILSLYGSYDIIRSQYDSTGHRCFLTAWNGHDSVSFLALDVQKSKSILSRESCDYNEPLPASAAGCLLCWHRGSGYNKVGRMAYSALDTVVMLRFLTVSFVV